MELAKSRFPKLLKTLETNVVDRANREAPVLCKQEGFDPGHVQQPNQCEDASREHLRCALLEGIQDGHVEVREITLVPSGYGEAVNASCGGYHGVFT
jgi:hypothetical protein